LATAHSALFMFIKKNAKYDNGNSSKEEIKLSFGHN
jgi:hypothetical protein